MGSNNEIRKLRALEALTALERVLLAGDSPGVKLAAGLAFELMTNQGMMGRPLSSKVTTSLSFAVSVTVLSEDMSKVLLTKRSDGLSLPRIVITDDCSDRFDVVSRVLASQSSADQSVEIALNGRALSVEIWDDTASQISIGFNFLFIARDPSVLPEKQGSWHYLEFSEVRLDQMDPRESLALSEMFAIMGFKSPYDIDDVAKSDDSVA